MNYLSKLSKTELNNVSGKVIESAIRVHSNLGPGLLEKAYEECLVHELEGSGMAIQAQTILPVYYENKRIDIGYRADLIVENSILVELKSVEKISALHVAQLLTYLRLSQFNLGLLINFNVIRLTDGIRRLIHD